MTAIEKEVPETRNWADEIDDLNRGALEKYLRENLWIRKAKGVSGNRRTEDTATAAGSEGGQSKAAP